MITEDTYSATESGPVGFAVKTIVEEAGELTFDEENYTTDYLIRTSKDINVRSIEPVNMNILSNSDIETLEFIAENFSRQGRNDLIEIAKSFTEWQKVSGKITGGSKPKMDAMDFFLGSGSEFEFTDVTAELVAESRERYKSETGL